MSMITDTESKIRLQGEDMVSFQASFKNFASKCHNYFLFISYEYVVYDGVSFTTMVMLTTLIYATVVCASTFDLAHAQTQNANFRVTEITSGATTLKWNAISGAIHYIVERDRGADGTLLLQEYETRTARDYHGAEEGTVLEYELKVYDSSWDVIAERAISTTVPANAIPVVNAGPDISVISKERATIDATVSDEHPEHLKFRWSEVTSENVKLICKRCQSVQIMGPMTDAPITATIKLVVTDLSGDRGEDTVNITINPVPNGIPIADAGRDRDIDEGKSAKLNGNKSFDSDGSIESYEWEQISGPIVSLSDPDISRPEFTTPEVNRDTYLTFKLTVTDDDGDTDDAYVTITVKSVPNVPPTADAGTNRQIVEPGDTITLDGSGSDDPDGGTPTYSWSQKTGSTVVLSSNSAESPTFTAPDSDPLRLVFLLTVTDNDGASASDMTEIIVTTIDAPMAKAGAPQSQASRETVTLDGSLSRVDPDGNPSYRWTQISGSPVSLSGANTPSPTFVAPTVTGHNTKELVFELAITDAYQTSKDMMSVLVYANTNPTADIVSLDYSGSEIRAGAIVNFVGYAVDLDGSDTITSHAWSRVSGPSISIMEGDKGDEYESNVINSYREFVAPNVNSDVTIRFTVVDHIGKQATDEITFTITSNSAPTANAGNDKVASPGSTVTLNGDGHDPDGDGLTYGWTQVSGTMVTFDMNEKNARFDAPTTEGVLVFELAVSDGGYEITDTVNVIVRANLHDPEAYAGNDKTVRSGDPVRLSGSGSDQDGDPLSYSWKKKSGPSITLSDANTQNPTFTAPNVRTDTNIVLELTVSDGERSGNDNMTVTVMSINNIPTVNAGSDFDAYSGDAVRLSGSGNDPEGQSLTYSWSKVSGPSIDIQNADRPNASFVAPTVTEDTNIVLKLTVTEGSDEVSDRVTVRVLENGRHEITVNGDRGDTFNVNEGGTITLDVTVTNPDNDPLTYTWRLISDGGITQAEKNRIESDIDVNSEDVSFRSPNVATGDRVGFVFMLSVSDGQYSTAEFAYVYVSGQ